MYIKGITDYSKLGESRETGLFAGLVSQDGEMRETKSGKQYGSASVLAFGRKDGTAAFMTIKSYGDFASLIANLRKGDHILCAGSVESREYNGKTYTDMMVDFLIPADAVPKATASSVEANKAALTQRMESAGFLAVEEEDAELPFNDGLCFP